MADRTIPAFKVLRGSVGVGTTLPSSTFHVYSDSSTNTIINLQGGSATNKGAYMNFFRGTTNVGALGTKASIIGGTSNDMMFYSASNDWIFYSTGERVRIKADGKVGIGTNAPGSLLNVGSSASANTTIRINSSLTAGSDAAAFSFGLDNHGFDFAGMRLDYSDRVTKGLEIFTATAYGYPITITPSTNKDIALNTSGTGNVTQAGGKYILSDGSGAIVGEISTIGGNNLTISGTQTNHCGFSFATNAILPATQSATNNNIVDLGQNGNSFKDFYLSGKQYFDGNSSSYIDNVSHDLQIRGAGGVSLWTHTGGTWVEQVTVADGGSVGIGTVTPAAPLNVTSAYSASATTTAIKVSTVGGYNATSGVSIDFGNDQGNYATWLTGQIASRKDGGSWKGALTFSTNNNSSATDLVERMRINGTGSVGIGTNNPAAALDLRSSDSVVAYIIRPSASPTVHIGSATSAGAQIGYVHANDYAFFGHDAAYNAIIVDSSGSVGIGTNAASTFVRLNVQGAVRLGRGSNDLGSYNGDDFDLFVGYGANGSKIMLYDDQSAYHSALIQYGNALLRIGLNNSNSAPSILDASAINIIPAGVGIGIGVFTARLAVKSAGSTTDQIVVVHSGNSVEIAQLGQSANGSSAGTLLLKNNSGTDKIYLDAAGTSVFKGGDIGFYEDTGTNARFYWSAANERLNLSASDYQLQLTSGSHIWFTKVNSSGTFAIHKNGAIDHLSLDSVGNVALQKSGGSYLQFKDSTQVRGSINVNQGADGLVFTVGSSFSERMRTNSTGVTVGPIHGSVTFNNTSSVSASTTIQQTYNGGTAELRFGSNVSTTSTSAMNILTGNAGVVQFNGFVGIGTASTISSSNELLGLYSAGAGHSSFKNASDSTGTVYIRNVSQTANTWQPYLILADSGGNRGGLALKYSTAGLKVHGQGGIEFWTGSSFGGGTVKMTIASGGEVGIKGVAGGGTDLSLGGPGVTSHGTLVFNNGGGSAIGKIRAEGSDDSFYVSKLAGGGLFHFTSNNSFQFNQNVKLQTTDHVILDLSTPAGNHYTMLRLSPNGTQGSYIRAQTNGDVIFDNSSGTVRMKMSNNGFIQIGNNLPVWSGSYGGALLLKGNNSTSDRYAQLTTVDSNGSVLNTGLIVKSGDVGIGTNAPARALDVDGRILADTYGFRSDTTLRWYYFDNYSGSNFMGRGGNAFTSLYDGGTQSMVWKGNGVGIGTNNPTQTLVVAKSNSGGVGGSIRIDNLAGAAADKTQLIFSSFGNSYHRAMIQCTVESSPPYGGTLEFYTGISSGTFTEKMRVDYNGYVGIGTNNPSYNFFI